MEHVYATQDILVIAVRTMRTLRKIQILTKAHTKSRSGCRCRDAWFSSPSSYVCVGFAVGDEPRPRKSMQIYPKLPF